MNHRAILPHLWHLEEDYRVYCTLVRGSRLAILWDTGQGKQDLRGFVQAHIGTPCLVLNSHGHSDHIGGNHRFPAVYCHPADRPLLEAQARLVTGSPPAYEILPLEADMVFDLGGLHARVISLTGHTWGSLGLLLEEDRILLAGDGLNPTLLLLGAEAAPLSRLRETLEEAQQLPFDHYLSGHAPGLLSKAQIDLHLQHLASLRPEAPSRPGPYGPAVLRSQYRDPRGRSAFLIQRQLLEQAQ